MALAVEHAAGMNHKAGSMDFAADYAGGLNFDAFLCKDAALKMSCNDNVVCIELAFDQLILA